MTPLTTYLVCALCAIVGIAFGFIVGWTVGHEEGLDDMAREIRARSAK